MTIKELKDKIRNAPNDAEVFMLIDKSESNWDEDKERWKMVYPIEYVTRESVYANDGWDNNTEINILLEIEEP